MIRIKTPLARLSGLALTATLAASLFGGSNAALAAGEEDFDGIGVRVGEVTASLADDPRAATYFIDHLNPGTTITRNIEVQNFGSVPRTVLVSVGATDVIDGTFTPLEDGAENDLTDWTSVPADPIELNGDETRPVPVTISIPADAAPGERYAAVWVQEAPNDASGVGVQSRIGVRMYIHVGPGGAPAPSFTIDSLSPSLSSSGERLLSARVTNTGGRALDLSGTVTLDSGPADISAGPYDTETTSTLKPGASTDVAITLDASLPAGPWVASVKLASGRVEQERSEEITFPDTMEETASPNITFIWLGAGALVFLACAAWIAIARRRTKTTSTGTGTSTDSTE